MIKQTIRGVSFNIDDDGFVSTKDGDLGHIEDCEALAAFLQDIFDIVEDIEVRKNN